MALSYAPELLDSYLLHGIELGSEAARPSSIARNRAQESMRKPRMTLLDAGSGTAASLKAYRNAR